jgi:hypothetical protein
MIGKKSNKPPPKDPAVQNRNTDKIWCPKWEQYRYVEACKATCSKINRCKAYADYREPRLI